jgi:hypothetical protein
VKKNKHGGKRKGAGRKPIEDKKISLQIYPRQSMVDILGVDNAKSIAIQAIEKKCQNLDKRKF